MSGYVIALDQGTTSSRAIVFDNNLKIISLGQYEFPQIYPQPGWVEHDPLEIWATQKRALTDAVNNAHIDPKQIAALGITNQRETTILWDRVTGQPVYNAIVWQCRRTAYICDQLKADGLDETVTEKTGLLIDAYFSGTKLKWLLDHVPGVRERAERGELCAGTVDSWLENPEISPDGKTLGVIPYDSTRTYVDRVLKACEKYQELYDFAVSDEDAA